MLEYALIGNPLAHSRSKEIHKMFGDYQYSILELPPQDLKSFLISKQFKGINVTIPYKQAVIPYCRHISEEAEKIGSVNTISLDENGELRGYNTDYYGFSYMLNRAGIALAKKKIIILGSGGTSKTAYAVAKDAGAAEIAVISRTGENNYSNIGRFSGFEIIINTTPVGMFPDNYSSPLSLDVFPNCTGVVDVIYNPLQTRLLQEAKRRGIANTGGLPMLVAQAERARSIFIGQSGGEAEIERVLKKCESDMRNIVFAGMPGCGKSLIAKNTARLMGRELIDTDELIEQREKKTCFEVIKRNSEEFFRRKEEEIVAECSKKTGVVIALGGGALLKKQNRNALKQNGIVIYLKRNIEMLETADRPLSSGEGTLERLFEERGALYSDFADYSFDNIEGEPEQTARKIIELVGIDYEDFCY